MSESGIEKAFGRRLAKAGYLFLKMGQDGWPDRLVVGPGGVVAFIEFKTPKGRVAPRQHERILKLANLGHFVFVIRDAEQRTVDEFLKAVESSSLPDQGVQ